MVELFLKALNSSQSLSMTTTLSPLMTVVITNLDHETAAKYALANAYLEADLMEKEGKHRKEAKSPETGASLRDTVISSFGTGRTIVGDIEVQFASFDRDTIDMAQVEAFLKLKGADLESFKVKGTTSRLTVKRVA